MQRSPPTFARREAADTNLKCQPKLGRSRLPAEQVVLAAPTAILREYQVLPGLGLEGPEPHSGILPSTLAVDFRAHGQNLDQLARDQVEDVDFAKEVGEEDVVTRDLHAHVPAVGKEINLVHEVLRVGFWTKTLDLPL